MTDMNKTQFLFDGDTGFPTSPRTFRRSRRTVWHNPKTGQYQTGAKKDSAETNRFMVEHGWHLVTVWTLVEIKP